MKVYSISVSASVTRTGSAQVDAGKGQRQSVPRSVHAAWPAGTGRRDPVRILEEQDATRLPDLVPIRHERMAHSPFAFYRGAAAVMAADLAGTPTTGAQVQACGDAHLANFGAFATPERNLIFDVNDFDETLRAPWEWDVKRLAASVVLAGRELGLAEKRCRKAAVSAVRSYRESMRRNAGMRALDVWYSRIDASELVERMRGAAVCRTIGEEEQEAHRRLHEHISTRLVADESGRYQIIDDEPLVFHTSDPGLETELQAAISRYEASLRDDVRVLYGRYREVDLAMKVVGVGSVGTRCAIVLYEGTPGDLFMLQLKEATTSVLQHYGGAKGGKYKSQGERCVAGQRLMQAASDLFLGWTTVDKHDYYVRQYRDMKAGVDLTRMTEEDLVAYASLCGEALARAHARSGDAAFIAGYLGSGGAFDEALGDFAETYADQTGRDYALFMDALKSGRLTRSHDPQTAQPPLAGGPSFRPPAAR